VTGPLAVPLANWEAHLDALEEIVDLQGGNVPASIAQEAAQRWLKLCERSSEQCRDLTGAADDSSSLLPRRQAANERMARLIERLHTDATNAPAVADHRQPAGIGARHQMETFALEGTSHQLRLLKRSQTSRPWNMRALVSVLLTVAAIISWRLAGRAEAPQLKATLGP
jgi:hypothetical protein